MQSQNEFNESSVSIQSFLLFLFASLMGVLIAALVLPFVLPNMAFSLSVEQAAEELCMPEKTANRETCASPTPPNNANDLLRLGNRVWRVPQAIARKFSSISISIGPVLSE